MGTPPVVGGHTPSMLRQARISAPSSSQGHFSLPQEILGRSDCSESQPLVTNPRYGCSYRAGDGEEITPRAGLGPEERGYGGADCYCELPRIPLLGTSVNKGKKRAGQSIVALALSTPCAPTPSLRLAQGSERRPDLGREEFRLFPGGEVSAPVDLVEVGEVGVRLLDPAARGPPDLAGERGEADRE